MPEKAFEARSVARGYPPEREAVRRSCGPEEDSVVRAIRWCGHLKEAIEEEEEDRKSNRTRQKNKR